MYKKLLLIFLVSLAVLYAGFIFYSKNTFIYSPLGGVYAKVKDCASPYMGGQGSTQGPSVMYPTKLSKIDGVSWWTDDVNKIGSGLIKIKGKLYDNSFEEYKKLGVDRTHNIGNNIDEATFEFLPSENRNQFKDKNKYYFYPSYGHSHSFNNCYSTSEEDFLRAGITMPKITVADSDFEKKRIPNPKYFIEFDIDSEDYNKINQQVDFVSDMPGQYSSVAGSLYYKTRNSGEFTQIQGVNASSFIPLKDLGKEDFYTDAKVLIFDGQVYDFNIETIKKVPTFYRGKQFFSDRFYIIENRIYFIKGYYDADKDIQVTDIDVNTFEYINEHSNDLGKMRYRDKNYTYEVDFMNGEFIRL